MKNYSFLTLTLFVILTACSGKTDKITGTWQSVDDPSKTITLTKKGDNFIFTAANLQTQLQGVPGIYNADNNSIDFDNGAGTIESFLYNSELQQLTAFGGDFLKAGETMSEDLGSSVEKEESPVTVTSLSEEVTETSAPAPAATATNCGKGQILKITGNNVRMRSAPDVTKQNILMQVHKGFEVVRQDETSVDGQKWYKVCYEGNVGWVSGQYAVK